MITEGEMAPDFTLPSADGSEVTLSAFRGQRVILYFYPKDDTPGCTVQACDFRDRQAQLKAGGAVVLGVSPDGIASHRKFVDKFTLNFPLLADQDHAVAEVYGVWKERSMYGRTFMGIERSTFLIDESGRLTRIMRRVSPKGHADVLLEGM